MTVLGDVIAAMKEPERYYRNILKELKEQSERRGLDFVLNASEGWGLHDFVRPGERTVFGIEDKGRGRAILGEILVPDPERIHSDVAWNRIEAPLREKLSNFDRNGHESGRIACAFLQVWENERRSVVIPLRELNRLKGFRDTGDFHVKKIGGEFFLQTPRWEENIKLKDSLEDLFGLIST